MKSLFGPTQKKVKKWREERNGQALLKAMEFDDIEIKISAIEAMGHIRFQNAISAISSMVTYPISSRVRMAAIECLGEMRVTSTIPKLIRALDDDDKDVSASAKKSLEEMGGEIVEPLIRNLSNFMHESVRDACRDLLLKMGHRSIDALVKSLNEGTFGMREEAAKLLGEIGETRVADKLAIALNDRRSEVRRAAADSLDSLHWQPGRDLYAAHYFIIRKRFDEVMSLGKAAIPALVSWLDDLDYGIRRNVAILLNKLGWKPMTRKEAALFFAAAGKFSELVKIPDEATEILVRLLSDSNTKIKKSAANALEVVGVPMSVKALVRDIQQIGDVTIFRLPNGTFNLDKIGLDAEYYKDKFYLLKLNNSDEEQIRHVRKLYPDVEIIDENGS